MINIRENIYLKMVLINTHVKSPHTRVKLTQGHTLGCGRFWKSTLKFNLIQSFLHGDVTGCV